MFILYGIKNCDTVKKACHFLDAHNQPYRFHDIRADGLDESLLHTWLHAVSWESLVNTRSKTWQQLSASDKQGLNEQKAVHLICQYPTLMKRPVLNTGRDIIVGFKEDIYETLMNE